MPLELKAAVSLDGSGVEAGLKRLEASAEHFGDALKGVALEAFGIYSVEQAMAKTLETAKELIIASQRLGVSPESFQVLKQAAKDSNVEMSHLVKAFEAIEIAREKALGHTPEGKALMGRFQQMGISQQMLQTMNAGQLFLGPMHDKALSTSQANLDPILRDIFKATLGRGFGELIPLLKTDFESLQEEMQKMGAIMSTQTAVALKTVSDGMELAGQIIIANLAPALVFLTDKLMKMAAVVASFAAGAGGMAGALVPDTKHLAKLLIDPFNIWGGITGPKLDFKGAAAAGDKAMMDEFGKWFKGIQAVEARIAELTKQLNNPVPPKFGANPNEPELRQHSTRVHAQEDSLIRVGNFLGSSRDNLATIAEEQTSILKRIEVNTRPTYSVSGLTIFPPS